MGGPAALRDSLRRLCADVGWSYAVFWKVTRAGANSPLLLVWGDGHCEGAAVSGFEAMELLLREKAAALRSGAGSGSAAGRCEDGVGALVSKLMAPQVHIMGEGVVGQAALTGDHKWILHDVVNECGGTDEVVPEMKQQFCAGVQTIAVIPVLPQGVIQLGSTKMVMEDPALINHVRSLFGQLGSGRSSVLPDDVMLDDSILKTMAHKSSGVNASGLIGGRINQCNLGPPMSASMVQSFGHSVQQFYAGVTPLCALATRKDSLNLASHSDLFQPMVPLDHGPNLLLNDQSEGDQLFVERKVEGPDVDSINKEFSHVSSSLKESNMTILSRRRCLSTEQHGFCLQGSMEITRNDNTASSCMAESQMLHKVDTLTSKANSVDSQISNPISVKRKFETVSIADGTKYEDDSATSYVPFNESVRYSNLFQSLPVTLRCGSSSNSNAIRGDGSHDAVDNNIFSSEIRNTIRDNNLPEHLKVPISQQLTGGNDLFDVLGLQQRPRGLNSSEVNSPQSMSSGAERDVKPLVEGLNDDFNGLIPADVPDQLLDAIVSKMISACGQNVDASMFCNSSVAKFDSISLHSCFHPYTSGSSLGQTFYNTPGVSQNQVKAEVPTAIFVQSPSNMDISEGCSQKQQGYKSHISLWVENSQSMASDSLSDGHCKMIEEVRKSNRKRLRPAENPKPRPKDRQMFQDRMKELREIVPNTAKCSIDALLEKTIKHMLFLQSVAKHADKLKDAGDPMIISQEGGLLLKDNFEGGATWAFEVGTQSMTCPIMVEDLNSHHQMLVEMLCQERGIFLEIADQIRGLGLTILKGVMEVHKDKIWARFAVEANKDVTRMEIFLSLVHLLEPSAGSSVLQAGIENISLPRNSFYPSSIAATGFSNCFL